MRKLNSILTALIMVLFTIHLIWGSMIITGMTYGGSSIAKGITDLMVTAICLHVIISTILTIQTLLAWRRSGVSYFRQNRLFWIRRISGYALMLFIFSHVLIFRGNYVEPVYWLNLFDVAQLAVSILMVLSLFVHLLCNITPLRIALGISDRKNIRTDILLVMSVLLFLAGVAFVIYYIRWSRV